MAKASAGQPTADATTAQKYAKKRHFHAQKAFLRRQKHVLAHYSIRTAHDNTELVPRNSLFSFWARKKGAKKGLFVKRRIIQAHNRHLRGYERHLVIRGSTCLYDFLGGYEVFSSIIELFPMAMEKKINLLVRGYTCKYVLLLTNDMRIHCHRRNRLPFLSFFDTKRGGTRGRGASWAGVGGFPPSATVRKNLFECYRSVKNNHIVKS